MSETKPGQFAKVHYTGTLADGSVFDSSREREPFEFAVGAGQVIPGFEAAIDGMEVGDTRTVIIPADEAYGPYREDMVIEIGPDQLGPGVTPEVGMQLQASNGPHQPPTVVTVTEVTAEKIVLDANHPLAGQDLTFEIELLELG